MRANIGTVWQEPQCEYAPMMNDIMATALSGLNSATQRFDASARRTVTDKNADLADELVTQKVAALDFTANLKVIKTADEMIQQTLDILA
jgi:flagellar hook protein FlgE